MSCSKSIPCLDSQILSYISLVLSLILYAFIIFFFCWCGSFWRMSYGYGLCPFGVFQLNFQYLTKQKPRPCPYKVVFCTFGSLCRLVFIFYVFCFSFFFFSFPKEVSFLIIQKRYMIIVFRTEVTNVCFLVQVNRSGKLDCNAAQYSITAELTGLVS